MYFKFDCDIFLQKSPLFASYFSVNINILKTMFSDISMKMFLTFSM